MKIINYTLDQVIAGKSSKLGKVQHKNIEGVTTNGETVKACKTEKGFYIFDSSKYGVLCFEKVGALKVTEQMKAAFKMFYAVAGRTEDGTAKRDAVAHFDYIEIGSNGAFDYEFSDRESGITVKDGYGFTAAKDSDFILNSFNFEVSCKTLKCFYEFEDVEIYRQTGSGLLALKVAELADGNGVFSLCGLKLAVTFKETAPETVEAVATYPAAPVAACEAPKADESDDQEINAAPEYTIKPSTEHGGSEIYFKAKPAQKVRDALKAAGFRWHGVKLCWYNKKVTTGESNILICKATGAIPEGFPKVGSVSDDVKKVCDMIEAADGVEAIKAENFDADGENSRGGAEVRQEAETAPEAKETAKAEAVPDSVRNYGKAAAMLETLESQVSNGESLPEHWRRVWKACGIKGVTVSSRRGGYTSSYTFKFTMMPGDLLPFENCREALEEQSRESLARGVWDDEKGGYIDYFHMTGDEQRAEEYKQARKYWEKVKAEGSRFSICHYWQINRKNSPEFSESFWRRWELVGRSVARLNYDRSDAMTDYFDVGFYEDWEIKPEGKAAYKPEEWYAIDNLYNLAKARDEKAEAERKAKEEAEAKKEREEREAHYRDLEEKAQESVSTWSEAFPHAAGVAPFVTVEWCEINALHETGEEHAQAEGTPATRWSLDAFNMVTEDLDRYIKGCGWFGYFKLKYTVEFPDGTKWTDRIDLGDGVGGLVESARAIVKYNEDRKADDDDDAGTIYGGTVENWRERLERLETATDPDAVAMARGLLELGETA